MCTILGSQVVASMWFYFLLFSLVSEMEVGFFMLEKILNLTMWLRPPRQCFTNFPIEFDEYMDNSVFNGERHPYGSMKAVRRTMNMWSKAKSIVN